MSLALLWQTFRLFLWHRFWVPLPPIEGWKGLLEAVSSVDVYQKDGMVGAPLEWSLYAYEGEGDTNRLIPVEALCAWTGVAISGATPIVDPLKEEIDYAHFGVRCCRCGVPIHVHASGMKSSFDTPSCPPCRRIVKRAVRNF